MALTRAYERLSGLGAVVRSQTAVVNARVELERRRETLDLLSRRLEDARSALTSIRARIDGIPRNDERYPRIIQEEFALLQSEERAVVAHSRALSQERVQFDTLCAEMNTGLQLERAYAERTKYWGIVASLIGTGVGLVTSAIVSRARVIDTKAVIQRESETIRECIHDTKQHLVVAVQPSIEEQERQTQLNKDTQTILVCSVIGILTTILSGLLR